MSLTTAFFFDEGGQPPWPVTQLPPPAGSYEEAVETAKVVGFQGALIMTANGQIEKGLISRLLWREE
jgi:hypothetical protein